MEDYCKRGRQFGPNRTIIMLSFKVERQENTNHDHDTGVEKHEQLEKVAKHGNAHEHEQGENSRLSEWDKINTRPQNSLTYGSSIEEETDHKHAEDKRLPKGDTRETEQQVLQTSDNSSRGTQTRNPRYQVNPPLSPPLHGVGDWGGKNQQQERLGQNWDPSIKIPRLGIPHASSRSCKK
jgi:hypothetical protein